MVVIPFKLNNKVVKISRLLQYQTKILETFFMVKKIIIGFDPKIHTRKNLLLIFKNTNCKLVPVSSNLVDKIWHRKKNRKINKFYALPQRAIGQNYRSKINNLINILKTKKVNLQFISSGENIAWLLNIRGRTLFFHQFQIVI